MKRTFFYIVFIIASMVGFLGCTKEDQLVIAIDGTFESLEYPIIEEISQVKVSGTFLPYAKPGQTSDNIWYINGKIPKAFKTNEPIYVRAVLVEIYPGLGLQGGGGFCNFVPAPQIFKIKSITKEEQ